MSSTDVEEQQAEVQRPVKESVEFSRQEKVERRDQILGVY